VSERERGIAPPTDLGVLDGETLVVAVLRDTVVHLVEGLGFDVLCTGFMI